MHIRCFLFCWPLFASAVQAAEKTDSPAHDAPIAKAWPLPTLEPDPAQRAAIEKALETSARNGYLIRDTRDGTLVQASLQMDQPPADVAFNVSLRNGDHTWRVGPMAWKKGAIQSWAYDLDLPEGVTQVDIVFTPSTRAGMMLSRFPVWPLKGLTSIWSGEPIIVPNIGIRSQDIQMIKQRPPGEEEAREHLIDTPLPNSEWRSRLAEGMALDEMRKRLDERSSNPNFVPEEWFVLGCVMAAQGQLDEATTALLKARDAAALADRLQYELRSICARWLHAAESGRLPEMFFLGRAYEEGNGVGRDARQAKYWYRKAANAGHAESRSRLAAMKPLVTNDAGSAAKALDAYRAQAATWHEKSATTYQEWVGRYRHKPFQPVSFDGKTSELKVVITTIDGEKEGVPEDNVRSSQIRYETELFADGTSRGSRYSSRGTSGGSNNPFPAATLALIDELIERLPDDRGILPPVNRRMLIETANKTGRQSHVYDLADLPSDVEELTKPLYVPAYVPRFQAFSSVHVRGFEHDGALAVTPQNEILYVGRGRRLQWWDPATHEFLAEADLTDVKTIVFAPDKVNALVQTYGGTVLVDLPGRKPVRTFKDRFNAQFTQDGRHVLLHANKAPVQILDTQSWEPVDHADDVPNDCTSFIPAPSIHRALVRANDGSVSLWDTVGHRPVTQLASASNAKMFAAFSPDESRVAVCAHPWTPDGKGETPVVIYNSDTGAMVRGISPFSESIQSMLWTPDGAYVIAAGTSSGGSSTVNVFNVATGRHHGELTGPVRINGMALLPKSGELVAGDQYGTLWFWDLPAVMERIREFEASLTTAVK